MKKGISIWSFGGSTPEEAFAAAKQYGFDGVEVELAEEGKISLSSRETDLIAVRRSAEAAGISLYSVASGLYWKYSLTSPDPAQREKAEEIVKKQIDAAAVLGCDTVLVVPGAVAVSFAPELGVVPYDAAYARSLEAVRRLAGYAEKKKVCIGLENVWNGFLLSPLEMRDFLDKVGSEYVGSYFDVGNVLPFGYPEQWVRILGKRIRKVHFKDFRRSVGTPDGFVELLTGDVDYPAVTEAFREIGYDGWVTAEIIPPAKQYPLTTLENASNAMDRILGRKR